MERKKPVTIHVIFMNKLKLVKWFHRRKLKCNMFIDEQQT